MKKPVKTKTTKLEKSLGYTFKKRSLFTRALTHRSMHSKGATADYEQLEFLGDAVIDLVVADLLISEHPSANEGKLSKMRAALVRMECLAEIAREIKLGDAILLSSSETAHGGKERPSILSDVFESIIGAIYQEAGLKKAFATVKKLFGDRIKKVAPSDPKTELQEILHVVGKTQPEYILEKTEGPEHAPTFVTVVKISGSVAGRGKGNSKKASQQAAAEEALRRIQTNG